jgi:hypothetical protein
VKRGVTSRESGREGRKEAHVGVGGRRHTRWVGDGDGTAGEQRCPPDRRRDCPGRPFSLGRGRARVAAVKPSAHRA